jgi:hypothetical protein
VEALPYPLTPRDDQEPSLHIYPESVGGFRSQSCNGGRERTGQPLSPRPRNPVDPNNHTVDDFCGSGLKMSLANGAHMEGN